MKPQSYPLHFLAISMIFITACSLFKGKNFYQTDSLQRQEIKRKTSNESTLQSAALSIYTSSDSSNRNTAAEIFPKGAFTYSLSKGFRGEADRVVIKEQVKQAGQETRSTRLLQSGTNKSSLQESEKQRTETRVKEKETKASNIAWLYVMGVGVVFFVLFAGRRFLK